jgi:ribonuclease E
MSGPPAVPVALAPVAQGDEEVPGAGEKKKRDRKRNKGKNADMHVDVEGAPEVTESVAGGSNAPTGSNGAIAAPTTADTSAAATLHIKRTPKMEKKELIETLTNAFTVFGEVSGVDVAGRSRAFVHFKSPVPAAKLSAHKVMIKDEVIDFVASTSVKASERNAEIVTDEPAAEAAGPTDNNQAVAEAPGDEEKGKRKRNRRKGKKGDVDAEGDGEGEAAKPVGTPAPLPTKEAEAKAKEPVAVNVSPDAVDETKKRRRGRGKGKSAEEKTADPVAEMNEDMKELKVSPSSNAPAAGVPSATAEPHEQDEAIGKSRRNRRRGGKAGGDDAPPASDAGPAKTEVKGDEKVESAPKQAAKQAPKQGSADGQKVQSDAYAAKLADGAADGDASPKKRRNRRGKGPKEASQEAQ